MKEYIEKAALKERFQKRLIWLKKDVHDEYSKGLYHGCETDMGLIDEILAADVVEVRHGRWIEDERTYPGPGLANNLCSVCGEIAGAWKEGMAPERKWAYCPACGALMDGKEDEHEAD